MSSPACFDRALPHSQMGAWLSGFKVTAQILMAGLVSACSEGYVKSSAQVLNPVEMGQEQRLRELKQFGAVGHLGTTWDYQLDSKCTLTVTQRVKKNHSQSIVPLRGTVFDLATDKQLGAFDIGATASLTPEPTRLVVYRSKKWTNAKYVLALLQQAQLNCVPAQ